MSSINALHTPANAEFEEPENHSFSVKDINFSGDVALGSDEVILYTHFDREVSLDRFEEILEDLLEWTRRRKGERGLQHTEPLLPHPNEKVSA